jgi:hypothetical protein
MGLKTDFYKGNTSVTDNEYNIEICTNEVDKQISLKSLSSPMLASLRTLPSIKGCSCIAH